MSSTPLPPVDLDTLDGFLRSDRAPPDCMDLSEIDGFLAALVGRARADRSGTKRCR